MAYGAYSGVDTLQNQVQAQAELEEAKKGQQAAVLAQKKKMGSEFQEQLEAAQKRAKKKAKKRSGLFKALNFAGMFLGPLGQALTGAVSGGLQAKQQRDAMQQQQQQSQVNSANLESRISLIEGKLDRLIKHLGVPDIQNSPITVSNTPPDNIQIKDNSQKDSKSNKEGK